ncbi:MAG TPA: HU family DNA-binding protein [Ignavibacteriaceae bacterium]|nr:HU family DNA-binding protein [Ignavibacteriaceae bacterium]
MTKAELIRKISKRAGVPDSEAKIFFEIFLKKSAELLSPGEAILLKSFGHFQLRKGKIRTNPVSKDVPPDKEIYVDLMVYYPSKVLEDEFKQNLIFNVPALQIENYHAIDSHFTLSIGKPVIPLKGVKGSDFFIPLTGLELRKLVEAKVDKIINEIEIVKEYIKGNELLVIDAESFKSHQFEFNWGEVPSKNISGSKTVSKKKTKKAEEINGSGIAWDFGYNLSKEIEEESILDVDKDDEESDEEGRNIGWNLGVTHVDERSENFTEAPENKIDESVVSEENLEEVNENGKDEEHKYIPEKENDFEVVRTISSTLGEIEQDSEEIKDNDKDEEVDWNFGKTTTVSFDDYEPDTQGLKIEDETESIIEDNNTVEFEDKESDEKLQTTEGKSNNAFAAIDKEENSTDLKSANISSAIERRLAREARYSKKGASPAFIIALIVIVAIAIILYLFLSNSLGGKDINSISSPSGNKLNTSVIERDYSVPVNYPYNKSDGKRSTTKSTNQDNSNPKTIDNKVASRKSSQLAAKKEQPKKENKFNSISRVPPKTNDKSIKDDGSNISFDNLPPPVNIEEIRKNITKIGDTFTAQVSSWRTESIAQDQVSKYIGKGYDAFMEQAEVPGKGTWYRVKIKNFKSMKEAEDFLIENL